MKLTKNQKIKKKPKRMGLRETHVLESFFFKRRTISRPPFIIFKASILSSIGN